MSNIPASSAVTAIFCLIMDELFDISNECEHLDTLIDDSWFSWLKYQILKQIEDYLTTLEVRQGAYKKPEKQKRLYNHKSTNSIKITVHIPS